MDKDEAKALLDEKKRKKYILVVEDDSFYADIYTRKFRKEGYEVELAENGKKALKSMYKRKPDLVLLDLIMPVMDGFQTLEEIRKNPNFKNIIILAVTNLGEKEDVDKIKKLGGVSEYIVKANVSIQDIARKVKKYLD